MRLIARILLVTPLVAAFLACGAQTKLSGVWSAGGQAPIPSLLVLGIGIDETSRRLYEDRLAEALQARGTGAVPSYRLLPDSDRLSREELAGAVERGGFRGVVITRLLAVDEKQTYVPPTTGMSVGMGSGYYGYYGSSFGVNYSPGYVQTTTIVRLETRLYDARRDELVWSAHSDTFQPSHTEDTVRSVTRAVVSQLAEDGWIL